MEPKGSSSCVVALIVFMLIVFPAQAFGNVPEPMMAGAEPPAEPEGVSGVFFAQTGSLIEHTPSIIQADNGTFFLAYESGTSGWHFTINLTWSYDGITWAPDRIIASSSGTYGVRHPTLIQRQDGQLQVVYLTDRTGAFQLYTSVSPDSRIWTEYGPLGVTGPAINPFMIQIQDGSYAMSYQRYGSALDGSYFATSADGITWATVGSRVASRSLPRVMKADGGNYLMTFQGGTSGDFEIRYKTSSNGVTWGTEQALTNTGNSHDSFPMQLANGTYMVFFASSIGGTGYDLYRKWSPDMSAWSADEYLETSNSRYDTEPHPCQLATNQTFLLSWGYESSGAVGGYENVDIALMWIEDITAPPTYDIMLIPGWNLISIPWIQTDTSPAVVLSSIEGQYEVVMAYDHTDPSDPWKSYRPGGSVNDLTAIDHTMGIWIKTSSGPILSITGTAPTTTGITILAARWQLVGYPSNTPMLASTAFGPNVYRMAVYDGSSPSLIRDVTDLSTVTLMPGNGYWVRATADFVWTVIY